MKTILLDSRRAATKPFADDAGQNLVSALESRGYVSITLAAGQKIVDALALGGDDSPLSVINMEASTTDDTMRGLSVGNHSQLLFDMLVNDSPNLYSVSLNSTILSGLSLPFYSCEASRIYSGEPGDQSDAFFNDVSEAAQTVGILDPEKGLEAAERRSDETRTITGLENPEQDRIASLTAAATALQDRDNLTSIRNINARGTTALTRVTAASDLLDVELISRQFASDCGQGKFATVAAAAGELRESTQNCGACGRGIAEHEVTEVATISSAGKWLTEKSRWMSVLTVMALLDLGIPREHIWMPPWDAGSDDLDLVFEFDSRLHVVELKDDNFDEGDGARFGVRAFQLDDTRVALVITTGHVSERAKSALATIVAGRSSNYLRPVPEVVALEEIRDVRREVYESFLDRHLDVIAQRFAPRGLAAGISVAEVVKRRMGITSTRSVTKIA